MSEIEIFLTIDITEIKKAEGGFEEKLLPDLKKEYGLKEVQFIVNSSELSFRHDFDKRILNNILSEINKEGYKIEKLFIHLPAEISGIRDVYDASARGQVIKDELAKIKGINGVGLSNNGIIKLETNQQEANQEKIIDDTLNIVRSINHD